MTLLSPFEWLFGAIMNVRNALYDRNRLKSHSLGAPAISIGNITAGGTGKTPMVRFVAEILAESGEKVCILTRGYGREQPSRQVVVSDGKQILADARCGGDEPLELAQRLLGKSAVVANADRVAAATWAIENLGATRFVLDDAFQHRRARRDLDIVCIDACVPFSSQKMLPSGLLREPLKHLRRAGAVIITRTERVNDLEPLTREIRSFHETAPIFYVKTTLKGLALIGGRDGATNPNTYTTLTDRAFVFCGIGNPKSFEALLVDSGINVAGSREFGDHHVYTQRDIDELAVAARKLECEAMITTGKDAVKLSGLNFTIPCYTAVADIEISDKEGFSELVTSFE